MQDIIQRCIENIIDYYGMSFIEYDENGNLYFEDSDGYQYGYNFNQILYKYRIAPVHHLNTLSVNNIRLSISKNNLNFELTENNFKYENEYSIFECVCKDCHEIFNLKLKQIRRMKNHKCQPIKSVEENEFPENNLAMVDGRKKVPPEDYNLGFLFPDLILDWDYSENGSPFLYFPYSKKKVLWICHVCEHKWFKVIKERSGKNTGCPECARNRSESSYQEKVRLKLEGYGYTILHEWNCNILADNPMSRSKLFYDNEVVEIKLIVETNGIQHYKINGWHKKLAKRNGTTPQKEFEYQQYKDLVKKEYALNNGYSFLEISYLSIEDGTYIEIIDNAIKQIINS